MGALAPAVLVHSLVVWSERFDANQQTTGFAHCVFKLVIERLFLESNYQERVTAFVAACPSGMADAVGRHAILKVLIDSFLLECSVAVKPQRSAQNTKLEG